MERYHINILIKNQTSQIVHNENTIRTHDYYIIILVTRKETKMEKIQLLLLTLALAGVWIIAFFIILLIISLGQYIYYTKGAKEHEKKHHSN